MLGLYIMILLRIYIIIQTRLGSFFNTFIQKEYNKLINIESKDFHMLIFQINASKGNTKMQYNFYKHSTMVLIINGTMTLIIIWHVSKGQTLIIWIISEGSCDTEGWINGCWKFCLAITGIKLKAFILNCNNFSQHYKFYCTLSG